MADGLFMLFVLGGLMALASFLAGSLPLSFSLSQRQMRLISAIGTGLLVGTALIVIIPEGIETLYSAESTTDVGAAQVAMRSGGGSSATAALSLHHKASITAPDEQSADSRTFVQFANPVARNTHLALRSLQPRAESEESHHHSESSSHAWIGVSLITGFILMYLIDALSQPTPSATHIPLANLSSPTASSPSAHAPPPPSTKSTTIGLMIHAFADGIALGASTATSSSSQPSSSSSSLGLIVFTAILVHKAPAAFGLTAVLLKQGLSKRAARGHLLLFSLAAPVGALVTWAFVKLLGTSGVAAGSAARSGTWWTGVVLVFSGGTFLYVAMHSMQATSGHSHGSAATDADFDMENPYAAQHSPQKAKGEVALVVTGMLLPLLTQIGHAHAHGG